MDAGQAIVRAFIPYMKEQTTFHVCSSDAENMSLCKVKHFTEYNIYCSLLIDYTLHLKV